jgi:hypothetical protein
LANHDKESGKADVAGVLITSPGGAIYNIPLAALEQFRVPEDQIDNTIVAAENAGLLDLPQTVAATESASQQSAAPAPKTVINIFVGEGVLEQPVVMTEGQAGDRSASSGVGSSMSKYAAGSTMSKYAAGSAMSKFAAGSTMSKFAAGSTMSKFAAGSTMSKYAAGSTMSPGAEPGIPFAVFYGRWISGG